LDRVTGEVRSRMMSAVPSKDTSIELDVRRGLFARGFRFRLHVRTLPGTPDIVLPRRGVAVFVNGCFWHGHDCRFSRLPDTRRPWWKSKIETNRARDVSALAALREMGWRVLVIWGCVFRGSRAHRANALKRAIGRSAHFMRSDRPFLELPAPKLSRPATGWGR
jgi:DNA mismatch endonuclease (patch repair protein)